MDHIGSHIPKQQVPAKKSRDTERGELMEYFLAKLNATRARDGLGAMSMGRLGRLFLGVPTQDLYYLKSICDDAAKRGNASSFSKKFWWEVNPKNHQGKNALQSKAASTIHIKRNHHA